MKVCVKLFAVARQRLGRNLVELELPAGATVRQLRAALVEQYPALTDVLAHARIAIDTQYAPDASPIPPEADVALIPPVSGG